MIIQIALHFFVAEHLKRIAIEAQIGLDVHHSFYILWEIGEFGQCFLVHKWNCGVD